MNICGYCEQPSSEQHPTWGGKKYWHHACVLEHQGELIKVKDAKMKIFRDLSNSYPSLNLHTYHDKVSHSWTLKGKPSWLVQAVGSLYYGVLIDEEGNVILTGEQKRWALDMGMLNLDEVDPEASIAGGFNGISRRPRKENPDDLTKNELIVLGYKEAGVCKVHGPSKAALADAGQPVNKKHIYYGCHMCNKVMGDGLGLMNVDEARPLILAELKARGVRFHSLDDVESRTEQVLVTKTIYSLKEAA